ncbi:MAG: universal stress protein [Afipia sp.]|nr:universal stress protein [Afipia sp.]
MIRNILLKVESDKPHDPALDYAVTVAEAFDAHLACIAFGDLANMPAFMMPGLPSEALAEILAASEKSARAAVERFEMAAQRRHISTEHHLVTQGGLSPGEAFATMARRFDLSLLQQSEADGVNNDLLIEAALLGSGRPVMIVPYIQKAGLKLGHVLCCWDGGAAAARAINDALPFLRKAETVEILVVVNGRARYPKREIHGAEIARHLEHHGIKAEVKTISGSHIDVTDSILSHAADCSADMIVMGGYGHSRLREYVLGGATRGILSTMTVPVFMSH